MDLPDRLAEDAKAKGLLEPPAMERMLRQEMARRASADKFFTTIDALKSAPGDPMSPEEIEREIQAARAERRHRRASRH